MSLEDDIKTILFNIGKEIKIHKISDGNIILDIDYDKYVKQLLDLLDK
jgi:hypothetical protein